MTGKGKERRKSKVWSYFKKVNNEESECTLCGKKVGQGSSKARHKNTSNFWGHLQAHHREEYKEANEERLEEEASTSRSSTKQSQPSLHTVVDKVTKWEPDDKRAKVYDKKVTEMIATDQQPFAVVDHIGLKRLLNHAEPRYSFKSEKYYRTEMLEQVYSKVQEKIKVLIAKENAGDKMAFTTDCWSGSTESLMSLTAHFIDNNWERQQVVLNTKTMSGKDGINKTARTSFSDLIGCV